MPSTPAPWLVSAAARFVQGLLAPFATSGDFGTEEGSTIPSDVYVSTLQASSQSLDLPHEIVMENLELLNEIGALELLEDARGYAHSRVLLRSRAQLDYALSML